MVSLPFKKLGKFVTTKDELYFVLTVRGKDLHSGFVSQFSFRIVLFTKEIAHYLGLHERHPERTKEGVS